MSGICIAQQAFPILICTQLANNLIAEPAPPRTGYISSLSMLRGVAALTVCIFHFSLSEGALQPGFFKDTIAFYGFTGVQLFFIISGFIIPYSMYKKSYEFKDIGTFLLKRAIRIEPPYLLSIVLVVVVTYISTLVPLYKGPPFYISPSALFLHLGYLTAIFDKGWISPVYWTLAVEFQFYIFAALFFPLLAHKKTIAALFPLLLLAVLHFLQKQYSTQETDIWLQDMVFYCWLFIVGILLFRYMCGLTSGLVSALLIAICFFMFEIELGVSSLFLTSFGVLSIVFLKRSWVLTDFLGKISYSLYLVHHIMGMKILNLCSRFHLSDLERVVIFWADIALCIFVAWIFYLIIEKPSLRWAEQLSYTGKSKR